MLQKKNVLAILTTFATFWGQNLNSWGFFPDRFHEENIYRTPLKTNVFILLVDIWTFLEDILINKNTSLETGLSVIIISILSKRQ